MPEENADMEKCFDVPPSTAPRSRSRSTSSRSDRVAPSKCPSTSGRSGKGALSRRSGSSRKEKEDLNIDLFDCNSNIPNAGGDQTGKIPQLRAPLDEPRPPKVKVRPSGRSNSSKSRPSKLKSSKSKESNVDVFQSPRNGAWRRKFRSPMDVNEKNKPRSGSGRTTMGKVD